MKVEEDRDLKQRGPRAMLGKSPQFLSCSWSWYCHLLENSDKSENIPMILESG